MSQFERIHSDAYIRANDVSLAVFSFLGLVMTIIAMYPNARAKQLATCTLLGWLMLSNFINLFNALAWRNEQTSTWWDGKYWCDIEVKLIQPAFLGVACSLFCITRRLAEALGCTYVFIPKGDLKRRMLTDCMILYLPPIIQTGLQYIVETNRYLLQAIGGCTPGQDQSWPTFVIMFIPNQIFVAGAAYYCVLMTWRMKKARLFLSSMLEASGSKINDRGYLRGYLMATIIIVVYLPMSLILFCVNATAIRWSKYSWNAIHDYPAWWDPVYIPFDGTASLDRWCIVAASSVVFAFYGLTPGSIEVYRALLVKMGFSRWYPSLAQPRQRRGSSSSDRSWISKLSVVNMLKKKLDSRAARKELSRLDSPTFKIEELQNPNRSWRSLPKFPSVTNLLDMTRNGLRMPSVTVLEASGRGFPTFVEDDSILPAELDDAFDDSMAELNPRDLSDHGVQDTSTPMRNGALASFSFNIRVPSFSRIRNFFSMRPGFTSRTTPSLPSFEMHPINPQPEITKPQATYQIGGTSHEWQGSSTYIAGRRERELRVWEARRQLEQAELQVLRDAKWVEVQKSFGVIRD